MTDYFKQQGRTLLANGYAVLPIKIGEKRPALTSWQTAKLTAADLGNWPGHGVGIICGQGAVPIVGVDVDVSHPTIGPALLDWCRQWLPGPAPERVGAAPRILLVYRTTEAGWTKTNSTAFFDPADPVKPNGKKNEQRVEVLGLGQQFVAYHEHPDTGAPYEWVDWLGGLTAVRASDLPLITEAQLADLMGEVDRLVRMTPGLEVLSTGEGSVRVMNGHAGPAEWMAAMVPPTGTSLEDTVTLLSYYKNEDLDYDSWVHVGMALHHEYGGSAEAFKVWADWSSASKKHNPQDMRYKWSSFDAEGTGRQPTTLRWLLKVAGQAKRDAELEQARDQIDAIKRIIDSATDSVQMTGSVAKKIKPLIPDDLGARAEVAKAFQDKFKKLTNGTVLAISEVRKALAVEIEPTVTFESARKLTEFGNMRRMVERYSDGLMYVPELEQWFRWNGIYWRRCTEIEIEHYAKETIMALVNEGPQHEGDAKFFEFCALSQKAYMVKAMVSMAKSEQQIMVPVEELDKHPHLLGVKNGVIDLRTGTLLPADPDYSITMVAGCEYLPNARAPIFEQTVADVFSGDIELMKFFNRLVGYSLLGNPEEDLMVIPWGNGSNGKSTVLNPIREAFGGYGKSSAAETFVSNGMPGGGGGGPREDIVRLKGARFVYVSEPDENGELRESMVKSMSGGDAIPARGLFSRSSIEIEPTWVSWMPTNHKPTVKGDDNGIWRRLVLIPFLRNFESDPTITKDEKRQKKIMEELPGILTWCVKGALRYREQGLNMPRTVKAARDEYRSQMDVLSDWVNECCETDDTEASELVSKLWASWEQWAKRNGAINHVRSSISLGKRMERRFPSGKGPGGVRIRRGLRLKMDLDPFKEVS